MRTIVLSRNYATPQKILYASNFNAQAVLASAEDRANGNRPKWRDVEVVPVPKKGQLKTAADKIPAIDKLPPPPKTLPAPVK